jgi:hypothetical protein
MKNDRTFHALVLIVASLMPGCGRQPSAGARPPDPSRSDANKQSARYVNSTNQFGKAKVLGEPKTEKSRRQLTVPMTVVAAREGECNVTSVVPGLQTVG